MLRARAWMAGALVAAARFLLPDEDGRRAGALEEDAADEGGLPPGHPVVVLSSVARAMVDDGIKAVVSIAPDPSRPAAGSLAARVAARRGTCP